MEWSNELQANGTYYEGWVDDLDDWLSSHAKATVTCYGTCRSSKASGNVVSDKENNITDQQRKVYTEW